MPRQNDHGANYAINATPQAEYWKSNRVVSWYRVITLTSLEISTAGTQFVMSIPNIIGVTLEIQYEEISARALVQKAATARFLLTDQLDLTGVTIFASTAAALAGHELATALSPH